jgi:hypothetical protein
MAFIGKPIPWPGGFLSKDSEEYRGSALAPA